MANVINGTDSADSLVGTDAQDIIYGNGGDDVIINNSAVANGDQYYGGDGNDSFYLNDASGPLNYTIDGGNGTDALYAYHLEDLTISNVEILVVEYTNNTFISDIASLNDFQSIQNPTSNRTHNIILSLSGAGATLDLSQKIASGDFVSVQGNALTSAAHVTLSAGNDYYSTSAYGDTVHAGDGNDYIYDYYNANNTIYGEGGNDTITVGSGVDYIDAGDGNDTINTSGGSGNLVGGNGDDTFNMNSVSNSYGSYSIDGGAGNDTVMGADFRTTTVTNVETLKFDPQYWGSIATLSGFTTIEKIADSDPNPLTFTLSGSGGTLDLSSRVAAQYASVIDASALTSGITLLAPSGNDTVTGTSFNDVITGGLGTNSISAGDGNDTIIINGGSGSLNGNAGDDVFYMNGSAGAMTYVIDGGAGLDTIHAVSLLNLTISNVESWVTSGNLVWLQGAQLNEFSSISTTYGSAFLEFDLSGDGATLNFANVLAPGTEAYVITNTMTSSSTVTLTSNDDNYHASFSGDTVHGGDGNDVISYDSVDAANAAAQNAFYGEAGDDKIYVGAGTNLVDGGSGNDEIVVNGGTGTLGGGTGNDLFVLNSISAGGYTIDGGDGTDTIETGGLLNVTVQNVENLIIENGGGAFATDIATISAFQSIQNLPGDLSHLIALSLSGSGGTLDLSQKIGSDSVSIDATGLTSAANVTLSSGNDVYQTSHYGDTVHAGDGNDEIFDVYGGNNTIFGEGGNDYIVVGWGNNYIDGGDGNDTIGINDGANGASGTIIGGAGDDTIDFTGSGPAAYVIDGGTGYDIVKGENFVGATITNVETLQIGQNYWGNIANLAGFATIESTVSNALITFALSGAGGTLDLSSQLSGDNLAIDASGLTSAADVTLGAGNDTYQVSQFGDTVHAGAGNDYIFAFGSNNVYVDAGDGNDTIMAGNGTGTLIGGAGDDTFTFSGTEADAYTIDGGTGNDIVKGEDFIGATIENVETLEIAGQYWGSIATLNEFTTIESTASNVIQTFTLSGAGGLLDMHSQLGSNYSTHIDGSALTSSLNFIGSAASDTVIGTAFNDTIDGGAGADTMSGGAGDDTYYIDNAGDFIVEQIGQGHDTAISTVSHTLESNVEDLILQGTAAINGTGNGLDNSISGNAQANTLMGLDGNDTLYGFGGNDILDGGTGADKMYGGIGDDTYYVDNAGDQVIENANEGTDTVIASINYVLPDNVENLTLSPTTDLNGTATGNALDNIITGNSGNNILYGKGGNDILIGGAGADTLDGTGSTTAVASYATATSAVVANLANASQNTGDAAGDTYIAITGLTGSDYADHLTGDSGNNVLKGGLGSDVLDGGAGIDTAVYDFSSKTADIFNVNGTIYVYDQSHKDLDQLTNIESLQFADTTIAASSVSAFDAIEYLASNTDLIQAFGDSPTQALQHFLTFGAKEGRATNSFDALEYLASNADLIQAFGDNPAAAEKHYIEFGFNEHRNTSSFDALEYLASNTDLIQAFGDNPAAAEKHYIEFGFNEHRNTSSFDALEYIASNADLIKAFGTDTVTAEKHYIEYGFNEHRNVSSFNATQYLANYPDLQAAFGNDLHAAEMHYILYGYAEHRTDQPLH